jgi:hypothetical protein
VEAAISAAVAEPRSQRWVSRMPPDRRPLMNRNHRPDAPDLFPPAAEGFIELNQALILVVPRLRKCKFRLKQ